jgi:hypothetical protein
MLVFTLSTRFIVCLRETAPMTSSSTLHSPSCIPSIAGVTPIRAATSAPTTPTVVYVHQAYMVAHKAISTGVISAANSTCFCCSAC